MKTWKVLPLLSAVCILCGEASAQWHYKFIFNGTRYQTNSTGNLVGTPITEQTILQEVCAACGVSPANMAVLYWLGADSRGDTINIYNTNTYQKLAYTYYPNQPSGGIYGDLYALYFGQDAGLGRTAVTNATLTDILVTDYVYTDQGDGHSVGAAFTTKKYTRNAGGDVVHVIIDGTMQWFEAPRSDLGTPLRLYKGTFSIGPSVF